MSNVPERIYGPVSEVRRQTLVTGYFCVDCALTGLQAPLEQIFQVSGTILCRNHALEWRKAVVTGG